MLRKNTRCFRLWKFNFTTKLDKNITLEVWEEEAEGYHLLSLNLKNDTETDEATTIWNYAYINLWILNQSLLLGLQNFHQFWTNNYNDDAYRHWIVDGFRRRHDLFFDNKILFQFCWNLLRVCIWGVFISSNSIYCFLNRLHLIAQSDTRWLGTYICKCY